MNEEQGQESEVSEVAATVSTTSDIHFTPSSIESQNTHSRVVLVVLLIALVSVFSASAYFFLLKQVSPTERIVLAVERLKDEKTFSSAFNLSASAKADMTEFNTGVDSLSGSFTFQGNTDVLTHESGRVDARTTGSLDITTDEIIGFNLKTEFDARFVDSVLYILFKEMELPWFDVTQYTDHWISVASSTFSELEEVVGDTWSSAREQAGGEQPLQEFLFDEGATFEDEFPNLTQEDKREGKKISQELLDHIDTAIIDQSNSSAYVYELRFTEEEWGTVLDQLLTLLGVLKRGVSEGYKEEFIEGYDSFVLFRESAPEYLKALRVQFSIDKTSGVFTGFEFSYDDALHLPGMPPTTLTISAANTYSNFGSVPQIEIPEGEVRPFEEIVFEIMTGFLFSGSLESSSSTDSWMGEYESSVYDYDYSDWSEEDIASYDLYASWTAITPFDWNTGEIVSPRSDYTLPPALRENPFFGILSEHPESQYEKARYENSADNNACLGVVFPTEFEMGVSESYTPDAFMQSGLESCFSNDKICEDCNFYFEYWIPSESELEEAFGVSVNDLGASALSAIKNWWGQILPH